MFRGGAKKFALCEKYFTLAPPPNKMSSCAPGHAPLEIKCHKTSRTALFRLEENMFSSNMFELNVGL